jgi:hypothetical protein
LEDDTSVPRSARLCTSCPRFRGVTHDPEDEMHYFVCPQYDPLEGAYPQVFNSRAYHQYHSADANKHSEVDTFPHIFLTQGGPEFWSQFAELLIACRFDWLAFQEDYRTLRSGLDTFSDDEDGADQSTHQEAPPAPSL